MIKKIFISLVLLALLIALGAGAALFWLVAIEPGDEISEQNIRNILGRESPVLYNDGTTPLGLFFADAHRKYIYYNEIPKQFIDALIAAEDNRFFTHFGFDAMGIVRAAVKNVQAGRVVQGGSTLTQQTAKNLFKREDRSYKAKLKELLFALRLEYHYSKEQILEFYVNQFYVSGNGLGLGVAARYYFDKTPDQLSLVESAYIAGSVKRPNYYNPFLQKSKQDIEQAKQRGKARVSYVLKKMRELSMIGESQFDQAMAADIPFNKGAVGYSLDYVMELVTEAVASDRVVDTLAVHGIDNIATSGIRIITTVDQAVQKKTLYGLRKQLSYLDVRMRGYERDEVQKELGAIDYDGDSEVEPGAFLFGEIHAISGAGDDLKIEVFLGRHMGTGIIDQEGLVNLADARTKWQKNRWTETSEADTKQLLAQVAEGDKVWVSVRKMLDDGTTLLDLERFPEVQGGAVVMRDGRIISVAGGVENRFFNRAVYGKRTMGSAYKPFVYTAALQLGWDASDMLPNQRDVFVFQNQPYFPRPDHAPESDHVSVAWAGVRSENLASVWLAAHLCDHLNRSQLEEVAGHVGLAPRLVDGEIEPYRAFRTRIRDRYGIIIDQETLREAAYRKTIQNIGPDLIFEGLEAEEEAIKSLHYGLGFDSYMSAINQDLDEGDVGERQEKELLLRKRILKHNFLALGTLRRKLNDYASQPEATWPLSGFGSDPVPADRPALFFDRAANVYLFEMPSLANTSLAPISAARLQQYLAGLDGEGRRSFLQSIRLGGMLSVAAYDYINRQVDREYDQMKKLLPYSMEVLQHVDDYRIMVGLNYLISLGKALGIDSTLEPVLSFPLGSNVVTLLETTRVYEGMVTGTVNTFTEEQGEINNSLAIIDRIESEDGFVLYRADPQRHTVVDPKTRLEIGHILENTVKFGTGRYADQQVKLTGNESQGDQFGDLGLSIPLLGKTGTANNYTNASFLGYLPALGKGGSGLVEEGGYSVGVYVGYDDNKVMRSGTTRVTGAVGALPAWVEIVKAQVAENDYSAGLDTVDLSFYGLNIRRPDHGQMNLGANPDRGGRLRQPPERVDPVDRYRPSIMTFGNLGVDGNSFEVERRFSPYWSMEENAQPADGGPSQ